ncbi:MAG TPA: hypothetical protein VNF26_14210 [Candidatus Baltobacterales bacterium]|nr:hypothetical protein [Candidatus Baltobacterales bacterium]
MTDGQLVEPWSPSPDEPAGLTTYGSDPATRDRALWIVRLGTLGGVVSALGLSWLFSGLAQAYFSGKLPAPPSSVTATVPVAAAPVQTTPTVVQTVVHVPYGAPAPSGSTPGPPSQGPAAAPQPAPPPVCYSTPSKPC